ncbi:MAG: tyrosine--tRNA ligase [Flavobacteriales bacterium]|nr:tyrosine--tRNA ligase [Flavobacteriales bacterium]|tara:strand:- start:6502 stop:7776 length:1275 start_codon:yes stop_codon:yes gene_type:complete
MNFFKQLQWRGMIHDFIPGTEDKLKKSLIVGYIGFDPTADSLHIGNLVQIMTLVHFQKCGHKPIILIGGATGMVGDPSGKSKERVLLSEKIINQNIKGIKKQLLKFLDFNCGENSAEIVNNHDWFKDIKILDFIRDIGKYISVNQMMSKDSVKSRLESGISFTEFTYQLIQGYDFYYLFKNKNCIIQLGGSDQWGNIVSGTELIRKKLKGESYALTTPLIKKSDGSKFGKTESGNLWLDSKKTSPYKFYQYWLNSSDADAINFIKIFSLKDKSEIEILIKTHLKNPHLRILQENLARELTIRVHDEESYNNAVQVSRILFGKNTTDEMLNISEKDILDIFEGVPQHEISMNEIINGINIIELLAQKSKIFKSNGEVMRMLRSNAISINKKKVNEHKIINQKDIIGDKYIIIQKGKKNYFLIKLV